MSPDPKPYRQIPIKDCGEPLVAIPKTLFSFFDPHPYAFLDAPYGDASPWMLRHGSLEALKKAQIALQQARPGWKIKLFDAYRPNEVQAFMVEHEYKLQAKAVGLDPETLTADDRAALADKVFRVWGIPSEDPATPPPHSTGGPVDCTLIDAAGNQVDMGSAIDENSERSVPDHYAAAQDKTGQEIHRNREFLNMIMRAQGFHQHKIEWWHFSRGDQIWAWIEREASGNSDVVARYGRADLVSSVTS